MPVSEMGWDTGGEDEDEEGTELTFSVYDAEDDAEEEASDEDPEGGEEGAM
jgi:hypothetical protein